MVTSLFNVEQDLHKLYSNILVKVAANVSRWLMLSKQILKYMSNKKAKQKNTIFVSIWLPGLIAETK